MNELIKRLSLGSFFALVTIFAIYYSNTTLGFFVFTLLSTLFIAISLLEYYQLSESIGLSPLKIIGITTSFLFTFTLAYTQSIFLLSALLIGSLFFSFCYYLIKGNKPLIHLATTFFGHLYLVLPTSTLFLIQATSSGRSWLFYAITVSKITDTLAYFGGSLLGKTALSPMISPKKTVEGALIGTAAAVVTSIILASLLDLPLSFLEALFLGLLLAVLAQLGDLFESLLKREAQLKDSSVIPGLGGLLDLIDSLVFTLPVVYGYIWIAEEYLA